MQVDDLHDRVDFVIDETAEPVDLDLALARFLLASIRLLETVPQPGDEQTEDST